MSNPFDALESTGDDCADCVECGQPLGLDRLTDAFPAKTRFSRVPNTREEERERQTIAAGVIECDCGESTEVTVGVRQTANGRATVDLRVGAAVTDDPGLESVTRDLEPGGSIE